MKSVLSCSWEAPTTTKTQAQHFKPSKTENHSLWKPWVSYMIDKTKYKFADTIFTLYYDWIFYTCISPIVPGVYYHLQMSHISGFIPAGGPAMLTLLYAFWLSVGYFYVCLGAYVCMAPTRCIFWQSEVRNSCHLTCWETLALIRKLVKPSRKEKNACPCVMVKHTTGEHRQDISSYSLSYRHK